MAKFAVRKQQPVCPTTRWVTRTRGLDKDFCSSPPSLFLLTPFTISPTPGVLAKMSVLSAGGGNDSFVQMLLACKTKGQLRFSHPAAQLVPRRGSCNRVPRLFASFVRSRRKFFPGICGADRISTRSSPSPHPRFYSPPPSRE